jgi:SAM-dependent methyltransferase
MTTRDPYAPLKERAWREVGEIDDRLERGEISEADWFDAMSEMVTQPYLDAVTPWEGSGKSGTQQDWEYSRSHIAHAIDKPGSFLDVGCANGYMLECLPRWSRHELQLFGLDISPELVNRARERLPNIADHLFVGNALTWESTAHFDFARTNLDYVPANRKRALVENLLSQVGRLIIGVFNEQLEERPTEQLVASWGYRIAGRSERLNLHKPQVDYRVFWVDSEERG